MSNHFGKAIPLIIIYSLLTHSCGKKKNDNAIEATAASSQIDDNTKPATLNIGSNDLVIPTGALAIGTTLNMGRTADPDSFTALFDLNPKASNAIEVSAKNREGEPLLRSPGQLILSLEYNDILALTTVEKNNDNLCVLALSADGSKYVWRRLSLNVDESRKIVKFSTNIFGTYQVVYCSAATLVDFKPVLSAVAPMSTAGATLLEGVWTSGCKSVDHSGEEVEAGEVTSESPESHPKPSHRQDMIVVGDALHYTHTYYYGYKSCDEDSILEQMIIAKKFTLGEPLTTNAAARKMDTEATGAKHAPFAVTIDFSGEPYTMDQAKMYNEQKKCEIENWQIGISRDVLGKNCGTEEEPEITRAGDKYYTAIKIESNSVCFASDSETHNGETEATRSTEFGADEHSSVNCLNRM